MSRTESVGLCALALKLDTHRGWTKDLALCLEVVEQERRREQWKAKCQKRHEEMVKRLADALACAWSLQRKSA